LGEDPDFLTAEIAEPAEVKEIKNRTMELRNGGQKNCFSNIPVFHYSIIPIFQFFSSAFSASSAVGN
jgi:hypothetical protein